VERSATLGYDAPIWSQPRQRRHSAARCATPNIDEYRRLLGENGVSYDERYLA
jgi:hypothetical protein